MDKKKYQIIRHKRVTLVILLNIYLLLFFPHFSKEEDNPLDYSYIEIKVNGSGISQIFYKNDSDPNCRGIIPPHSIQINDNVIIDAITDGIITPTKLIAIKTTINFIKNKTTLDNTFKNANGLSFSSLIITFSL